jgi:hypothetical protein
MKRGVNRPSLMAKKFNVLRVFGCGQEPGAQVMITPTSYELETICTCPGWMTEVCVIWEHGFGRVRVGYLVYLSGQICACMGVALLFLIPSETFLSRELVDPDIALVDPDIAIKTIPDATNAATAIVRKRERFEIPSMDAPL